MEDLSIDARKAYEFKKAYEARKAAADLQEAKLKALQDTLGNYGDFRYVDFDDFIDPDNQTWSDYTYKTPGGLFSTSQGRVSAASPIGMFISHIRDAKNTDDIKKQLEIWNSYKPLDSSDNGKSYIRYFIPRIGMHSTTDGSDPVQTSAGGTGGAQGVVTVGGTQGTQGVQDAQAGNTGTGTQGTKTGGTGSAQTGSTGTGTGTGSTGGAQAGNSGSTGGGVYASSGVAKGGTKTIGYDPYDPNPGNVSLAYAMRNAPEQERRTALIDEWNREHGISYATGKDGLIYRTDPQHPNGYVDPFKNDLSKIGSTGYATGKGMLTSGSNGTYATGEGIKDANGNVLTNPGGDWEYQYALRDPNYGLFITGKLSDAQKNYLQAVSDGMGYNYKFTGAGRYR